MNWSNAPVEPGDIIAGKFKVEQVLGTGGVGVVVAARHLQLDERVALKFLLPEAVRSEVDVARFCREAQAAVRLRSEHVARVTDVGTLETGSPYMVMEYLTGTDLGEHLAQRGPLPQEEAVDYLLQACEAIAEAHSVGFVHRDIKPSNLFVTHRSDGSPLIKVLDFGIAKATQHARIGHGEQELTRTRTMLGSPMYMSPEQVRNSKTVDERTDLWSLGVVLYELLAGRVPFDGDSVTGVVAAVIGDPLPPLKERCPHLPEGLCEVVATCLQKKADDRYQSVTDLAYALRPYAAPHSLVCIERIAGTLGAKAKYRSGVESRRGSGGNLAAATTVKSREASAARRSLVWAAALGGGAAVVAVVALLAWGAGSRAGGATGAAPDLEAAPASASAAPTASTPVVVPAEPVAPLLAAPSATEAPAPPPRAEEPPPSGPKPPGTGRKGPAPQPPTAKPPKPPGPQEVIDSTVDTRR